jgi:23S rRNA (cytidine1920-2'-O)/16S rRNA (cytidine1409-2'-O)-methyltransferase
MPKERPVKRRLDVLLVERGLADSRQKAQAMILAGEVSVAGQAAAKAGVLFPADARIAVSSRLQKYASRGGLKLEGALEDFALNVAGLVCLDVGASAGGFTDCLLQHGAARVYAVDVTTSQMAWKLQQDPRVVRLEKNARELAPADIPEPVDFVTVDVSFISVDKVIGPAARLARPGAGFLILVKPQFELSRGEIGKGGIVREPDLHKKAVDRVRRAAATAALEVLGVKPSRLPGAKGNQEFFLRARRKPLG